LSSVHPFLVRPGETRSGRAFRGLSDAWVPGCRARWVLAHLLSSFVRLIRNFGNGGGVSVPLRSQAPRGNVAYRICYHDRAPAPLAGVPPARPPLTGRPARRWTRTSPGTEPALPPRSRTADGPRPPPGGGRPCARPPVHAPVHGPLSTGRRPQGADRSFPLCGPPGDGRAMNDAPAARPLLATADPDL